MTTDPIDPAIEAAARAIFDIRDDAYDTDEWEDIGSSEQELYLCQARAALEAATPLIAAKALAGIRRVVESERDHARAAHQSALAETGHFAHDYCRWVGHAEALTNTLRDIDTRADDLEAGQS